MSTKTWGVLIKVNEAKAGVYWFTSKHSAITFASRWFEQYVAPQDTDLTPDQVRRAALVFHRGDARYYGDEIAQVSNSRRAA
jgi:hypothetical protein